MRRREFLGVLAGAAATWPHAARAQQAATPVIGFVSSRSPGESASVLAAFRMGLSETGYAEGRNVHIALRWAEGQYDRLPALVDDLVKQQVSVIVALGPPAAAAVKKAATSIPVVFNVGLDPVAAGLVASLNRPGGTMTGVSFFSVSLAAKRLGLLRELIPNADLVAMLVNPNYPDAESQMRDAQAAPRHPGERIAIVHASTNAELDAVFAAVAKQKAGALMVAGDPFFDTARDRIVALAARYAVPTIYHWREFVANGGLMSYGASIPDAYRQSGIYTGRILKGEKPAQLPVMLPTKFELVINLKTAKTLGLAVPATLLATADEVIE
jgi:putative tryptophan/tyrosine transport system substrate-binding protein